MRNDQLIFTRIGQLLLSIHKKYGFVKDVSECESLNQELDKMGQNDAFAIFCKSMLDYGTLCHTSQIGADAIQSSLYQLNQLNFDELPQFVNDALPHLSLAPVCAIIQHWLDTNHYYMNQMLTSPEYLLKHQECQRIIMAETDWSMYMNPSKVHPFSEWWFSKIFPEALSCRVNQKDVPVTVSFVEYINTGPDDYRKMIQWSHPSEQFDFIDNSPSTFASIDDDDCWNDYDYSYINGTPSHSDDD